MDELIYLLSKATKSFSLSISEGSQVWMSHSDTIKELPTNAIHLASTADVENAAFRIEGEKTYAIQFHPEVYHSTDGKQLLENFLVKIAGVEQTWTPNSFVETTVANIKQTVGNDKVVLRTLWRCRFLCCCSFITQGYR